MSRHRGASWRAQAGAIAFALLLVSTGGAAEELRIGGTGAALGTMQLLAREFTDKNPDIRLTIVPGLGSGGSVRAVAAGGIGLGVTSRPMNESERKLGAEEIEYARTPFVFAVSAKSAVTAITAGELADIYAGRKTAWADGSPVRIVLRPASDIDTEIVRSISAGVRVGLVAAQARPGVNLSVTDQNAADSLEKIPGAIGPSTLALILSEERALRALQFDGRNPTLTNAASGAYPYYKRLFLVIGAKRSAATERFVAFVQSPAGQKILVDNGQWIP
ncbi:MAG: substrate-binding domain-containing protein [Burkholderiales bacterium]|nr:substrate-binding domain-containing protein [Burkholderiales bacterium]